ncbi:MAG: IS1182 family transposase [Clostridia bacterium]|nr:IS1182 family transposase [Clostridia bacterium]NLS84278.1 IS1182 family transposase [Oscillospiraceae bacterium]
MLWNETKQLSLCSVLYDRIPEDHLLKRISAAVDFSFVNEKPSKSYCKDNGRPAKEPEMMLKLLLLEYLYNLSDVKVIEEANCNLAYLWFLGLNPEDSLPDASLLAKFRRYRLVDMTLDDILTEIVRQCVDKGIIKGNALTVDSTHIEAAVIRKTPERILRHLAKRLFKAVKLDKGSLTNSLDTTLPDCSKIEDPNEVRRILKEYLGKNIAACEATAGKNAKRAISEAREVLADEKFMIQKGIRSLADKDARVGRKSRDSSFYGYKMEYTMTADERIITAVGAESGEYVDGTNFDALMNATKAANVPVKEVYGDKAYFRAPILQRIEQDGAEPYIPVSQSAYRIDEESFSYNKDSDQWICRLGNETVACKKKTRKNGDKEYSMLEYTFDAKQCATCQNRESCMGKQSSKARKLQVSVNTSQMYEWSQRQKSPEFLTKYKKRAAEEWKNGEMKRFHGLKQARGFGLVGVAMQAKLTALAVNLKRIAAIFQQIGGNCGKNSLPTALLEAFFSPSHLSLPLYH